MSTVRGMKYTWYMPTYDRQKILELALECNISIPVVQVLCERGFTSRAALEAFIWTSDSEVGDERLLKDAEKAVNRIIHAIKHSEKILIAGDYDVDGITSSALMMICLQAAGAKVNFFLPNRVRDGYGLSVQTVQRAAINNYALIITVDNGITAFDAAAEARRLGIDLIITDHHRPHDHLPEAFAIIDPHQIDCEYPYKKFAGVGISFKVMALLYKYLDKELPSIVYELLLLGTVADVVPLTGENRFWVRSCLTKVNKQPSHALQQLKQNARLTKERVSSLDVGFSLAPQLNALGRLEDPRDGVKFLIGGDQKETEEIGKVLQKLNETRKSLERSITAHVEQRIATKHIDLDKEKIIIDAHDDWPPGVIGLVASRLVSAHARPAILLHITAEGIAKGSCRSIPQFNIFEALQEMKDLLISFGGHPAAAGLSLRAENIAAFKERLLARADQQLSKDDLKPTLRLEAELMLKDVHTKLVRDIAYLEPFGCENPQPLFYLQQVTLLEKPLLLKEMHVKCLLFAEGIIKPVIFFNRPELFTVMQGLREPFDVVVQVVENTWQNRTTVEFYGIDIAGYT
jgi:single-stranded-DNA-specific exonuclease